jgi:SAM-dependent methyltransferase
MERLRGFDDRGQVFTDGEHVYRHVPREFADTAFCVMQACAESSFFESRVVQTEIDHESDDFLVLRHPLHTITYPNEWTAGMLLDACLLTLDLAELLDAQGLALKDALPSNVVFESGRPVLIDFSSIITKQELASEQWLVGDSPASDPRRVVLKKMFLPFMVAPYLVGAGGSHDAMADLLLNRWCNSGNKAPGAWDVLRLSPKREAIRGFGAFRQIVRAVSAERFPECYESVKGILGNFSTTEVSSDYSAYYETKRENHSLTDVDDWTKKQKSVAAALDRLVPDSVLDLGCNTGWFSVLAAAKGSTVISLDSDAASVETLHRRARQEDLNIVVACLPFEGLLASEALATGEDQIGVDGGLRPAMLRFRCSMVFCLGLIHHLVLGAGHSVELIMRTLAALASDSLVLEVVSLEDDRIVEEPDFFPHLDSMRESYTLAAILDAGGAYFRSIEVLPSNPSTRTIIVFSQKAEREDHTLPDATVDSPIALFGH